MQDTSQSVEFPGEWCAVRLNPPRNRNRTQVHVDSEVEVFRAKDGTIRKRRVQGSGKRVFLSQFMLRRAGFETFLPLRRERRRIHPRRAEERTVMFPDFPGWIFVKRPETSARWAALMDVDMVRGIAGAAGQPMFIPSPQMEKVMSLYPGGCRVEAGPPPEGFADGDSARFVSDCFPDEVVNLCEVKGETAKTFLRFFGAVREVEVSTSRLSRVQ